MGEDRNNIVLTDTYLTTRRKYELLRIDEVSAATGKTIVAVEEAMGMVAESWEPDGEMEIEVTVKQRMKRKPRKGTCDQWCDPQTGVHSHG